VLEMLRLLTGHTYTDKAKLNSDRSSQDEWNRVLLSVEQTYETNTELADLYEAWALRCFGMLCFVLVSRQVKREVPTVKYIISTIKNHLESVASEGSGDRGILEDIKILSDPRKLLFEPLQQTSSIGVRIFVWTYAMKSVYLLTLTFLAQLDMQLCGAGGKLPPYLDGACFLASTLAIYNIVVFEHYLKDILKEGHFRPFAKFLGVKVMVSIAFMQSFVLNVLAGWMWGLSKEQINLCYSCLICCEVLPLSLLLLFAWKPSKNDWHGGDFYGDLPLASSGSPSFSRFQGTGQLADEDTSAFDDSVTFQRSRELSSTMGPRPALCDELTGIIELRGEVEARQGKAVEDVVNSLSKSMRAQYKPAALFRGVSGGPRAHSRALLAGSSCDA